MAQRRRCPGRAEEELEMRKLLLAGAAILALGASASAENPGPQVAELPPGMAEAPNSCLEWPVAMAAAQVNNPDAALVKVLEGSLAQEFIEVVNQLPPASAFDGDHAALFFKAQADQFLVVIGAGGCANHVVELPAAIFARMVGQPV
jgi:hypothetical protein